MKMLRKLFKRIKKDKVQGKLSDNAIRAKLLVMYRNISNYKDNITWDGTQVTQEIFNAFDTDTQMLFMDELMTAIESELK